MDDIMTFTVNELEIALLEDNKILERGYFRYEQGGKENIIYYFGSACKTDAHEGDEMGGGYQLCEAVYCRQDERRCQKWAYRELWGVRKIPYATESDVMSAEFSERCLGPACEERPAPSLVTENDLVSKGMMMRIPDAKDMPDYCGKIWFSGDQEIFEVDPRCCTAEVGAEPWIDLEDFSKGPEGNFEGIDGCYALDPFQNGLIQAILVNGCYDNGNQYYGEKCGGSRFGDFTDFAVGECGESKATCACRHFVESAKPGCFSIATPQAEPQLAVFLKMEGCVAPGESSSESGDEPDLLSMTYKTYSKRNCAPRFETESWDGQLIIAGECMEQDGYWSIMTCKETDLLEETIYEDADCTKPTGETL